MQQLLVILFKVNWQHIFPNFEIQEYRSYFEAIEHSGSEIIGNLTDRSEVRNSARCVNSCTQENKIASYVILATAIVALLENVCLVIAVASWKLCRKHQMLRFLWHLAISDSLLSFSFIFYHCRCLSVCPLIYT